MNKKVFEVSSTHTPNGKGRNFWRKKCFLERIDALEKLRIIIFGYDPSTSRFQRTLTITQLKKD